MEDNSDMREYLKKLLMQKWPIQAIANSSRLIKENAALRLLQDMITRLISMDTMPTLLQSLVDAAMAVAGTNMSDAQLYDDATQSQQYIAQHNLSLDVLNHFIATNCNNSSTYNDALRLKKRIIINNIAESDYSDTLKAVLFEAGIQAIQTTPIIARNGKSLGIFSTYWNRPHYPEMSTLQYLDLLAHEAADLIEYRQREVLLLQAKEQAERANQTKDVLLATLSHELRTPLNIILLWIHMLKNGIDNAAKQNQAILAIEESALAQNQIVNDLLDISRINLGKLRLELQPVNISDILHKTIDSFLLSAEEKFIKIEKNIIKTDIYINSDPVRLKQIFWNLLTNSLKFTPQGGKIKASLFLNLDNVIIKFHDTGKGIKQEYLPYIFDLFSQADPPSTRMHTGLGLGLALTRSLLNLQGGKIQAASEGENKGATFTVTLPLLPSLFRSGYAYLKTV